ncbi:hypothetical protein PAPYR_13095 [Paratrimastix pyriformis]|uniref:Uncharacterized protein n=1 Tax=Paratrimastix pyriformis TaxID=342808 RepID=A0ABQ8U0U8_9EUKA|nr:hypothetical protein PAPYR_13095 [Paratrimastix pyriformis]
MATLRPLTTRLPPPPVSPVPSAPTTPTAAVAPSFASNPAADGAAAIEVNFGEQQQQPSVMVVMPSAAGDSAGAVGAAAGSGLSGQASTPFLEVRTAAQIPGQQQQVGGVGYIPWLTARVKAKTALLIVLISALPCFVFFVGLEGRDALSIVVATGQPADWGRPGRDVNFLLNRETETPRRGFLERDNGDWVVLLNPLT